MHLYRLDQGLVLKIGEAIWRFRNQIDDREIQLENQSTGRIRRYRISNLTRQICDGEIKVIRDADPLAVASEEKAAEIFCTDSLPSKHKEAYLRAHDYVRGMRKRGISRGQRARIASAIELVAACTGDTHPPTASTVMRWMRLYEMTGGNSASLISGNISRRRRRVLASEVRRIVDTILDKYYFIRNGCTQRVAHDRIQRELSKIISHDLPGETPPNVSPSTVRRIIEEVTPYDRDMIRMGPVAARAKWRFSVHGRYALRPLERVEMDHTLLDLWVIDEHFGIPLGRPTVTILVCSYTNYIIGLFISFEGESLARVLRSIKIAIQPKDALTSAIQLSNPWHSMGLWETLVVDNALAYHSPHMRHIAGDLNIDIEYCPVRMPWFKPNAERMIGEICAQIPFQGRPRKPGSLSEPFDPRTRACVTFTDLCFGLLKWVVDVHPFEINHRKHARPIDLFLEGLDQCPPPLFADSYANLDILAGISKFITIDHSGATHKWIPYASEELRDLRREVGTKFKAHVKFDSNNLGSIFVQHPIKKSWISVPAKDPDYANNLSLVQHLQIIEVAKEKLKASNAIDVLRNSRLDLQDFWMGAISTGKKIKRSAKEYALLRGMSSASVLAQTTVSSSPEQVVSSEEIVSIEKHIPTFETFSMEDL